MSSRAARGIRSILAVTVLLSVLAYRVPAQPLSAETPGPVFTHLAPDSWVSLVGPDRSDTESDGEFWITEPVIDNTFVRKFSKDGRPLLTLGTGVQDTLYAPAAPNLSQFGTPTGVSVDSARGVVYVADNKTKYIRTFSSATGQPLRSWATTATLNTGQYALPWAIDVGTDGTVYVSEYSPAYGRVMHAYSPSGAVQRTSPQLGAYIIKDLTVTATGTVYAITTLNSTIYKLEPSSIDPSAFLAPVASVVSTTASEPNSRIFLSIDVNASGDLVLADKANGRIITVGTDDPSVEKSSWGSWPTSTATGTIADASVLPNGMILTICKSVFTLDRWAFSDPTWVVNKHFTPAGTEPGQFTSPKRSVLGTSTLFVMDAVGPGRIQQFALDGTYERTLPTSPTVITALTRRANGDLLLAGPGHMYTFGIADSKLTTLAASSSLVSPADVEVATDGSIVIADAGANAVFVFDSSGATITRTLTMGFSGYSLSQPSGLALLPDGSMWVADKGNHRLQYFDAAGAPTNALGSPSQQGNPNGWFVNPTDVAAAPDGSIWFTDTKNNRVGQYCPTPPYSSWHGTDAQWWYTQFASSAAGVGDNKFKLPEGITISPSGVLYVCDTGSHHVMSSDIIAPDSWSSSFSSAWTSGTPGVRFFATDDTTPTVKVRVNSGTTFDWPQDTTYTPSGEGALDIEFYAVGVNGFEELPHNHALLRVDRTAPSELTIDGASEFWTNVPSVPLTIAATDTVSGVQRLSYRIGSGPETTYTAPLAVDVEGITTVTATARDFAGNAKTVSARVSLDRLAPSVTIDAPTQAQEPVSFSLSASDQGSGVSYLQYRIDDDAVWHPGPLPSIVSSTGADETHVIRARAYDTVGNVSSETTKAVRVIADSTPPSGTVTFAEGRRWVSDGSAVSVVASFTDAVQMRLDPGTGSYGAWSGFVRNSTFSLPPGDGEYRVSLQLRDAVGAYTGRPANVYSAVTTIGVDGIDPHTDATADVDTKPRFIDAAAVTFDASDDRSGVASTYFIVDGGPVRIGSSVLISGEGDHQLEWWSVDNAGNEEPHHSRTVRVMRASTSATVSVTPSVVTYPGIVTLTGSLTDSATGGPIAYTRVIVESAPTVFGPWRSCGAVNTNRDGTFSFTDKPVGRMVYRIRTQDTPLRKSAVALTGVVTVKVTIGRPVLPLTSLYAGKAFLSTTLIRPGHDSARTGIVFRYYHDHGNYAAGRPVWNLERTVTSRTTPVDASTTRLSAQVALPSPGVWMVRVEHPADAHPYAISAPRVFLVR